MSKLINVASFKYRADTQSPWQELVLTGDVSALGELVTKVLQADVQPVQGLGTSSPIPLAGLTADHVVGNWGMFSDANCTQPIPENAPTCDLTITTSADAWTFTVENFTSAFYLKPTFIKE